MKKFLSGLLIGVLITASVTVYAAVEYNIIPNSFPIYVDEKKEDVEALNINGYTWIRLGSISKVLNASVIFDEVSSQIIITTGGNNLGESDQTKTVCESRTEKPTYYTEDGQEMAEYEGKKYTRLTYLIPTAKGEGFLLWDSENKKLIIYKSKESYENGDNPVIDSVPYTPIEGRAWVEYDYYTDTILPLIEE